MDAFATPSNQLKLRLCFSLLHFKCLSYLISSNQTVLITKVRKLHLKKRKKKTSLIKRVYATTLKENLLWHISISTHT